MCVSALWPLTLLEMVDRDIRSHAEPYVDSSDVTDRARAKMPLRTVRTFWREVINSAQAHVCMLSSCGL